MRCLCVCFKGGGIQRETERLHEWVGPLFQKIWPEPRTSWKHLCNSGLTNSMLSSERKKERKKVSLRLCVCNVTFKLYRSLQLHAIISVLHCQLTASPLALPAPHEHARTAKALVFVTCPPVTARFTLRGICCIISQGSADYFISYRSPLCSWQTGWYVEPGD